MCEACGTSSSGVRMEIEFLRRYVKDRESGRLAAESGNGPEDDLVKARELLAFLEQSEEEARG